MVAPPTSTTTTSRASVAASTSTPVSTRSGVGPRTIAAKSARALRCLPPITWARNISRIAARAEPGASTPILGTTLSASTYGVSDPARSPATSSRASTLPATTTGVAQRAPASIRAPASSASVLPPSVPPTSSTTSGLLASSPGSGSASVARATTCTTLPPLDSATRRPASAVTSSSLPTTATRSPPPADEQASTFATSTSGWSARSAPRHASYPSRTSVSIVVRCEAVPSRVPGPGVDERCLGERRPEVDAQHGVSHRGRPPGPRPGRRRSRCRRSAGSGRTAPRARCRRPRRASSGPGARSATRRRRATPRA